MENTQLTLLPLPTLSACVVSIAFGNWTMRACQSHVYGYDQPIFHRSQYLSSVVRPPRNYPAWSCHGGTPPFDPLQLRIRLWHLPLFLAVFYVALSLSTATCCYTRRVDLLPSWISIASGHYSTRKNRASWSKGASVCMWTIQMDPIETTGYARRLPPKELTELSGLRPKANQISDRVHTADMYWVCHGIGHHNLQVINKITAIIASTPATSLA